jgi:hypothetical protein
VWGVPDGPMRARRAPAVRAVLALAALLTAAPWAAASGVDGAGRIVVVPLVFSGPGRESMITITNPTPVPITIQSTYVGVDGTPKAGSNTCLDQGVPGNSTLKISLTDLCGFTTPDVENRGYVQMISVGGDARPFFATSVVLTSGGAETSVVPGQPMGAYTPAARAFALGLRTEGPTSPTGEVLRCYVGAFDLDKKVTLFLLQASGLSLGSEVVKVGAGHMREVNLPADLGLPFVARDGLSLFATSKDNASAIVGCASDHPSSRAVAWQPAQADQARDTSRLTVVDVFTELHEGPYAIGDVWTSRYFRDPFSRKVTLSTYLRADDTVRCWVQADPNFGFDNSPWLELQVRGPDGKRVAGGSQVTDTGNFKTGPRGRYAPSLGNRWFIDVSLNEDLAGSYPKAYFAGVWGLHCESAAGMSQPLGVPLPPGDTDDF